MAITKNSITQKELRRMLEYSPEKGRFTWLESRRKVAKGDVAGCASTRGDGKTYRFIGVKGALYLEHRLAWLYQTGSWPVQIDHIDGNGENNKWSNLRNVSPKQNQQNKRLQSNNTSGATGVRWRKNERTWEAYIKDNQRYLYLGCFRNFERAVQARLEAEKLYGFHKNHGSDRPL